MCVHHGVSQCVRGNGSLAAALRLLLSLEHRDFKLDRLRVLDRCRQRDLSASSILFAARFLPQPSQCLAAQPRSGSRSGSRSLMCDSSVPASKSASSNLLACNLLGYILCCAMIVAFPARACSVTASQVASPNLLVCNRLGYISCCGLSSPLLHVRSRQTRRACAAAASWAAQQSRPPPSTEPATARGPESTTSKTAFSRVETRASMNNTGT